MPSVAEEFESQGFWYARDLNKWLLVVVTLLFGIALGSDIILEMLEGKSFPVEIAMAGLLSVGCVVLLWVRVTWAAVVGLIMVAVSLFTEGLAYSLVLAVLLVGVGAMVTTKLFRRSLLAATLIWTGFLTNQLEDPTSGVVLMAIMVLLIMGSYGLGSAFRKVTNARLQSRRELDEVEARHRESVAAERKSIARDLHDIVAHDITIIAMQSRAAQMADTEDSYRNAVEVIGDSSRAALQDLRRMLNLLREDGALEDLPTSSATELDIRTGAETFCEQLRGLGFTVSCELDGDLSELSRSVHAALYRILQECTTNVARYAGHGQTCWIRVWAGEKEAGLTVTNTVASRRRAVSRWSSSGAGLIGIRDRAAAFGGQARAGFDRKGHWVVTVQGVKKD